MAVGDQLYSATGQPEIEMPFALKALSLQPSLTQLAAVNMTRYANTMFKGGYLDVADGATGRLSGLKRSLGRRTGAYVGDVMQSADQQAFGRTVFGKYASKKLKPAAMNNLNPLGMGRFDSVARLTGLAGKGRAYTPFQGVSTLVDMAFGSNKLPKSLRQAADALPTITGQDPLYAGGVFGRISTMNRIDDYQKAVAKAERIRAAGGGATRSEARVLRRGARASQKLSAVEQNIVKVGRQSAQALQDIAGTRNITAPLVGNITIPNAPAASNAVKMGVQSVDAIQAGGRISAVSNMTVGRVSNAITTNYGIFALGAGSEAGFSDDVLKRVGKSIETALERSGKGINAAGIMGELDDVGKATRAYMSGMTGASEYADDAVRLLRSGNVKAIRSATGKLAYEAFQRGEKGLAAKLGGQYLGTYGKVAGKAFNAFGWATLSYDVGKGLGNLTMGGVNTLKDAVKSFQGSINKPLFGAGFKDNEVASTSRARGVMAIQNSRLNARSMLGSEAGMLAAHFG